MLFGADPEFPISDGKGGFVSASEVFGKKDSPTKVGGFYGHSCSTKVFRDGFGVEFNVPPDTCRGNFGTNMMLCLQEVNALLRKKHLDWSLTTLASVPVPLEYLAKLPDDVQQFGCDPSNNAYNEGRPLPIGIGDGKKHPWRYFGGHIHFGFNLRTKENLYGYESFEHYAKSNHTDPLSRREEYPLIVKVLDLTIGLPLSLIFNTPDEFQRRQFYGKAGEFRVQPWGLEYRVPSPKIWNHVTMFGMALGVGRRVFCDFERTWKPKWKALSALSSSFEGDLQRAINNGDGGEDLLQEVLGYYNKDVVKWLSTKGKKAFNLLELTHHKYGSDSHVGYGDLLNEKGVLIPGSGGIYV